jgi:hypothetical protein
VVIASGAPVGQYHGQTSQKSHTHGVWTNAGGGAILRANDAAVSPSIAFSIGSRNPVAIHEQKWSQFASYRAAIRRETASEAQYQPRKGRSRLLIGLGVVLAAVYVGFLAVWYWATRIRPRAFDTPRRML